MMEQGTPHGGILYRHPNGDISFWRDDLDGPVLIEETDKKALIERHAGEVGKEDFVRHDLPKEILDVLEDLYEEEEEIALIGIWWVWGPTTPR